MAFEIFVSYSTSDLGSVEALRDLLSNSGIKVFVAEYSIKPSENLSTTLTAAVKRCDLFMVLWSKNAKNSEWVMQEIGQAKALNKKILPLVLDEKLDLPGFIQDLKYLSVFKGHDEALRQAQEIVMAEFRAKKDAEQRAERERSNKQALAFFGVGALLLWATKQK